MTPDLTIGITTRNRPDALRACIESLALIAHLRPEVLVFDDGSTVPAVDQLAGVQAPVRIIRDAAAPGPIAGRNRLVRDARASIVLLLDDDARLLSAEPIERAMSIVRADARVAAVAFAQAEADGRPWPDAMQPSRATTAAVIGAYIGFATLIRRSTFVELGGYRELWKFYGEEKDYCIRLVEHGALTVYLPDALVAHVPSPHGRSGPRYLRFVVRNDCLFSIHNDPLPRAMWVLPARLLLYFRMRRRWHIDDPWGWAWIVRDLAAQLPAALAGRRPVSRRTIARWRMLRREHVRYTVPAEAHAG